MNVGICVLIKEGENIWKNGILQNCIFFYDLLEKIPSLDKVSFIQVAASDSLPEKHALSDYNLDYMNNDTLDEVSKNYDLLISLGALPAESWINKYKENPKNRFVQYKGGNEFMNEIETVLYGQYQGWPAVKLKRTSYKAPKTDEVWMVPQQELHNLDYSEIKHKCKARITPFVWSPKFIDQAAESFIEKGDTPYHHEKTIDKWLFASFEPNMSVLKNMIPLMYAAEYAYETYPYVKENLDGFMMTNAHGLHGNESLVAIANDLTLKADKKITFDGRYPIVFILAKYAHAVVSHQWGNALNYAYLDACHFGMPLIHNAHLCKDLGYYYEDWKLKDIARLIDEVMQNHPKDDSFMKDQRQKLKRYTIDNADMVKQYEMLIHNLWDKNDIDDTSYDWSTNLLK